MTKERFFFLCRYGISGLVGGAVQTGFLYLWVSIWQLEAQYLVGTALGFLLALAVSFALQKYWTFRDHSTEGMHRQALLYTIAALINLSLNEVLLAGAKHLAEFAHLDFFRGGYYIGAQLLIVFIVAVVSFLFNYFFTFRSSRPPL